MCINYANKLKVRTNDLEFFAGEIGQLAGSHRRKDFCPPPPRPPPWATVARGKLSDGVLMAVHFEELMVQSKLLDHCIRCPCPKFGGVVHVLNKVW